MICEPHGLNSVRAMYRRLSLSRAFFPGLLMIGMLALAGCPGAGPRASRVFSTDTTLEEFTVPEGELNAVRNNAVITVTGDTVIDGTLQTTAGRLTIVAQGNVTINGELRAVGTPPNDADLVEPLAAQPGGIFIIIGDGALTFGPNSGVTSTGPVVITDDESVLDETPEDLYAEVENVAGEDIPTLVPLPPDDPIFGGTMAEELNKLPTQLQDNGNGEDEPGPVTISGTWPGDSSPPVPGDQPVVILRFSGARPLILDGWTVNGPAAPSGQNDNETLDPGENATGSRGRNGVRLNIRNNGGPINIVNAVVLSLANGGNGGSATAVCANATGGNGGMTGNFRMSAAEGIDISGGTLTINPGRAGNGGTARVSTGAGGADGCPGGNGAGGTARGGTGASNEKRIFVRGNVTGIDNVNVGPLAAGNGGEAIVEVCTGGNGEDCCDAGNGGNATAIGGNGGNASMSVSGLDIAVGRVTAGNGGEADATGGDGGTGGLCKFDDGGDGGNAGTANATGGDGGDAANDGEGGAEGGNGGDASAVGGGGGAGGDSGFGVPGAGRAGGAATATAGNGGAGATPGTDGDEFDDDGDDGDDGEEIETAEFCLTLADFVLLLDAVVLPGQYEGPVTGTDNRTQIGEIDIFFLPLAGAEYEAGSQPVPHVGIGNGILQVDLRSLVLDSPPPGAINGIRLTPLFAEGIGPLNPLRVRALAGNGTVLDTIALTELPNNLGDPASPESVELFFDTEATIAAIDIIAPANSFVTLIRVYLLDP